MIYIKGLLFGLLAMLASFLLVVTRIGMRAGHNRVALGPGA